MDAGLMVVLDHILYLKVLKGNQIARGDERVCLLAGKIFTLPLYLQMDLCQLLPGLLAIGRFLLFAPELTLQPLQPLFGFAIGAWVLHGVSFRVGREGLEANIKADSFLCWNMLNVPISLYAKLNEVAVGTADNANPFDLLEREGFNLLVPDEAQASNATAISEDDVFTVGFQLPAGLLVVG